MHPVRIYDRTEGNKWMGLGSSAKLDSVVAESRNMSSLGGADHGCANRWTELELPLADFMLDARKVLRRQDPPPLWRLLLTVSPWSCLGVPTNRQSGIVGVTPPHPPRVYMRFIGFPWVKRSARTSGY